MHVTLVGGGRDLAWAPTLYAPFVAAGSVVAVRRGRSVPRIAIALLDEGDGVGPEAERFVSELRHGGELDPRIIAIPLDGRLPITDLTGCDAMFVGGGLTPGYAAAIVPVRKALRAWLRDSHAPYAGFSAGAAIAATWAVVGGWRNGGVPVCPEEAGEDLDEVTVVPGIGLVPYSVEAHADAWGTTPRLQAALQGLGPGAVGYAIDENTALVIDDDVPRVVGAGRATRLQA